MVQIRVADLKLAEAAISQDDHANASQLIALGQFAPIARL